MEIRLEEAVLCAVTPYLHSNEGICTVSDSRDNLLGMISMLAYSQENYPIGRTMRYPSDLENFKNPRSKQLLQAVLDNDLTRVVNAFEKR